MTGRSKRFPRYPAKPSLKLALHGSKTSLLNCSPPSLPLWPTLTNSYNASLKHTSPHIYTHRSLQHCTVLGTVCSSSVGDPTHLRFSRSRSSSRNGTLTAGHRSSSPPISSTQCLIMGCYNWAGSRSRFLLRCRKLWKGLRKQTTTAALCHHPTAPKVLAGWPRLDRPRARYKKAITVVENC